MEEQQQVETQDIPLIDEATKRSLIKNFFHYNVPQFPSWYAKNILITYFSVAAGLFIIFYFPPSIMIFAISLGLIALGFYNSIKWIEPYYHEKREYSKIPSVEQMEAWLIEDIHNIVKPNAKSLLSIPSSIPDKNYIIIPYPVYWSTPEVGEEAILRTDAGGYFIYSVYKIQILVVAESFLSYYQCTYNWVENQIVGALTQEFFFEDISSINTATETLEHKIFDDRDKEDEEAMKIGNVPVIIINNKAAEQMKAIVDIPVLNASPNIRQNTIEILQILRILLRNRRAGEFYEE